MRNVHHTDLEERGIMQELQVRLEADVCLAVGTHRRSLVGSSSGQDGSHSVSLS